MKNIKSEDILSLDTNISVNVKCNSTEGESTTYIRRHQAYKKEELSDIKLEEIDIMRLEREAQRYELKNTIE
ncbi:MAG: hypothetical protein AB7E13_00705 [Arcobacteraceae bacterium]|jgi:hypothetical protein